MTVSVAHEELAQDFGGGLLRPGDAAYDVDRLIWNGRFDRRPAVLAQCTGTADVARGVRFAREHDLPLSVLAGGHDLDGRGVADDALALDLSRMNGVVVDPRTGRALVQGGARWRNLDREAQLHGLGVTGSAVAHTGVAGCSLGGGIGWLMRKYGSSADSILSIEAVTVEGEVVRASADEHPELFWGMRGAGWNFAIATSFEFQLHPIGQTVLAGALMHPGQRAGEALRFWRDFMSEAPEEVNSLATIIRVPEMEMFPPEMHGQLLVVLQVCCIGPSEQAEAALKPLREWGPPLADTVESLPYATFQRSGEEAMPKSSTPAAARWYAKSGRFQVLADDTIDTLVAMVDESPVATPGHPDMTSVLIWGMGGALARVEEDAMAFTSSKVAFDWSSSVSWTDAAEDERWISWVRRLDRSLAPVSSGAYLNLTTDDDDTVVADAFGADKYRRLVELKRRWDPENVLRSNKNIPPDA